MVVSSMSKSCIYYCIEENRSDQSRGLELYRHYAINYTPSRFDRRLRLNVTFHSMLSHGAICFHLHVQHFFVFFSSPRTNSLGLGSSFRPMGLHEESDPSDPSVCSIFLLF